jgi:hypothetical protein
MAEERFNPIAKLPTLPGGEIVNDEIESNIIDSTYPPKQPPVEAHTEKASDKLAKEEAKNKRLMIIRTVILIGLVAFIFLGIFITLNYLPRIAGNASNFSKSFASIFVSKKTPSPALTSTSTPTQTKTLVAVPQTATSTALATIATPRTASYSKSYSKPARLVVGVLSTNTIGDKTFVRFNVQNVGNAPSGQWSFSATLPANTAPTYYSGVQNSIGGQSGIIYTLAFYTDRYQYYPAYITVQSNQGTTNSTVTTY